MTGARLLAICVKEFWAILRDKRIRATLLAMPILQFFIFGLATTLEVKNIDIGVLNRDVGAWSQEVIQRVQGSPNVARVIMLPDGAAVRRAIDHQQVIAVLRFEPDFSANVASGRGGTVGAIFDGRRSNAAQIVAGYLDQIVTGIGMHLAPTAGDAAAAGSVAVNWFNPNLDYVWFTMPALIAIIPAITTLSVVAQSVAREKELGTFDQLMVSPLRVHEILIGKMVPPVLVGLFVASIYIALIPLVFHVPLTGPLQMLYVALVPYLMALTGIGMLISVLSTTQQQAFLGMFLVAVPTILLSGYASPIDNMPDWLAFIARADPAGYFLTVSEGVFLKAMTAGDVLANAWPLAVIATVTLTAASLLFRSRMT
ncbi:ABC transporter permease [Rhodopila sp.]|uniref:ABC transporter permease n=1 Tax=Rhodopila sp. TaxID=2480087 RepID=UPI002BA91A45|nr:ABC transporter permease [Rhodopila sp.]HVZ10452.1 ABC transporter permease [Rhodopila sp.]